MQPGLIIDVVVVACAASNLTVETYTNGHYSAVSYACVHMSHL